MQQKDYPAAARWYKNILKTYPNNVVTLNNLAWVLGQLNDPTAIEYGQKALSLAPNAPAVMDTVGWLYVEKGDIPKGLELLNSAHQRAPGIASIQLNLAKALIKAGQGPAAREHLEALSRLPGDTPVRQEAEKLLATL
jgi:tetratricopeptide (TPR) repeat protein